MNPILAENLVRTLLDVYRENPKAIKRLSPALPILLEKVAEDRKKPKADAIPFGLTDREREERSRAIGGIVRNRTLKALSAEEACRVLEHVAAISINRGLPGGFGYKEMSLLVSKVIGRVLSGVKSRQTFPVSGGTGFREVVVLRGIRLRLTGDFVLTEVELDPKGLEERRRALSIVGIGRDERDDVAEQHDRYLAMEDPHGNVP